MSDCLCSSELGGSAAQAAANMAAARQVATDPILHHRDRLAENSADVFLDIPLRSNDSRLIMLGHDASRIARSSDLLWLYSRFFSRSCCLRRRRAVGARRPD